MIRVGLGFMRWPQHGEYEAGGDDESEGEGQCQMTPNHLKNLCQRRTVIDCQYPRRIGGGDERQDRDRAGADPQLVPLARGGAQVGAEQHSDDACMRDHRDVVAARAVFHSLLDGGGGSFGDGVKAFSAVHGLTGIEEPLVVTALLELGKAHPAPLADAKVGEPRVSGDLDSMRSRNYFG